MVKAYAKGSRAERELAHFLNDKGFATIRVPSSGGFLSPLDMVAIRKGQTIAFEVKNHKIKPRLSKSQAKSFSEWCKKAGVTGFVVWRRTEPIGDEVLTNSTRWKFLRIEDALNSDYSDEKWFDRNFLLRWLNVE